MIPLAGQWRVHFERSRYLLTVSGACSKKIVSAEDTEHIILNPNQWQVLPPNNSDTTAFILLGREDRTRSTADPLESLIQVYSANASKTNFHQTLFKTQSPQNSVSNAESADRLFLWFFNRFWTLGENIKILYEAWKVILPTILVKNFQSSIDNSIT